MFGNRLRELRIEKGLTQKQLADIFGLRKQNISDWEVGRVETNFEMLCKIADYFRVSTDYLFGREDY